MASERYTMYRPNADKTDVIVQYPLTIADQVFDFEKGQFLHETLREIYSNIDGMAVGEFTVLSNSDDRITTNIINVVKVDENTITYGANNYNSRMGLSLPKDNNKDYLCVTKLNNLGAESLLNVSIKLAYRSTLTGGVALVGKALTENITVSPNEERILITKFNTGEDTTVDHSANNFFTAGVWHSGNNLNVKLTQKYYDVTNLSDFEINEIDWLNLDGSALKANFAYLAKQADTVKNDVIDLSKLTPELRNSVNNKLEYKTKIQEGSPSGRAYDIARNEVDTKIWFEKIVADGYGILVNSTTPGNLTGDKITIIGNDIYSKYRDPLEFNNPELAPFSKYLVLGNFLKTGEPYENSDINSGFALGIAAANDVLVTGNIAEYSRQESLHIEDSVNGIVVSGNLFLNSEKIGYKLLPPFLSKPFSSVSLVTNNLFKMDESKKTVENDTYGIFGAYTANGMANLLAPNNVVQGFDIGINATGGYNILDNTVVENCDIALQLDVSLTPTIGTLVSKNCPVLVKVVGNSKNTNVKSLISMTSVDVNTMFDIPTGKTLSINNLEYSITTPITSTTSGIRSAEVLKNVNYIDSYVRVLATKKTSTSATAYATTTYKITGKMIDEVFTPTLERVVGTERDGGMEGFNLRFNGSTLISEIYSNSNVDTEIKYTLHFDGFLVIKP